MTRAFRVGFWLTPIIVCLALYWLGVKIWFSQDDFAWLGLRLQVHDWPSFLDAMFVPKAQGTIRPWSERGFFMLFSYLFGLHALPYRIFVFCNQFLNIILLMLVTRKLTRSQVATFLAPIFWLVNIGLVTPMAWTSAYNEIQCATFLLLSFYLFLLYTETGLRRYYWAVWLTFVLGFGALEINFVFPVLACGYALLFARSYIRSTLPILAASAIYVVVDRVAGTQGSSLESSFYYELSFRLGELVKTLTQYWIDLMAAASYANLRHWPVWVGTVSAVMFCCVVVGFVAWQAWKRNFLPLFFLGWFLIVLGPLLPLHNHVSEYYLAVPTLGTAMLAAYAVSMSWEHGWKSTAVVGLLFALYLYPAFRVVQLEMRSYYDRASAARVLIQSVAYAKRAHPDKVILLNGVDDDLFWAAIYDSPFRIFGWNDVFVTPESKANIHDAEHMSSIDHYFLPPRTSRALLARSGAMVYAFEGTRLRNVTRTYTMWVQSQPAPPLDRFVDLGVPFYSDQLGEGWFTQDIGYRWSAQRAVVYLAGPTLASQTLEVHGFVTQGMVTPTPLHFELTIDGHAEPVQTIGPSNSDFTFNYNIPPDLIGHPKVEIAFNVDRATHVPGDGRALGIAFGTFTIH